MPQQPKTLFTGRPSTGFWLSRNERSQPCSSTRPCAGRSTRGCAGMLGWPHVTPTNSVGWLRPDQRNVCASQKKTRAMNPSNSAIAKDARRRPARLRRLCPEVTWLFMCVVAAPLRLEFCYRQKARAQAAPFKTTCAPSLTHSATMKRRAGQLDEWKIARGRPIPPRGIAQALRFLEKQLQGEGRGERAFLPQRVDSTAHRATQATINDILENGVTWRALAPQIRTRQE